MFTINFRSFQVTLYNEENIRYVTFKDFIDKELILFSYEDLERSIPSCIDGFKPGQRKVIWVCFKRNDKKDVKVAQFWVRKLLFLLKNIFLIFFLKNFLILIHDFCFRDQWLKNLHIITVRSRFRRLSLSLLKILSGAII